jgi:hypothetical protein
MGQLTPSPTLPRKRRREQTEPLARVGSLTVYEVRYSLHST